MKAFIVAICAVCMLSACVAATQIPLALQSGKPDKPVDEPKKVMVETPNWIVQSPGPYAIARPIREKHFLDITQIWWTISGNRAFIQYLKVKPDLVTAFPTDESCAEAILGTILAKCNAKQGEISISKVPGIMAAREAKFICHLTQDEWARVRVCARDNESWLVAAYSPTNAGLDDFKMLFNTFKPIAQAKDNREVTRVKWGLW